MIAGDEAAAVGEEEEEGDGWGRYGYGGFRVRRGRVRRGILGDVRR